MNKYSDPDPGSGIKLPGSATLIERHHVERFWIAILVSESVFEFGKKYPQHWCSFGNKEKKRCYMEQK
jgi:hypothetical protein